MSTPHTVIAFFYPKADKLERVLEIVSGLIADVQENEPDTVGYEWYKSVDEAGSLRLTIIEKYTSKEAFDAHCKNPKLGEVFQKAAAEGLMVADTKIEALEPIAGFAR